jgi:hypothetical protein
MSASVQLVDDALIAVMPNLLWGDTQALSRHDTSAH